jgi:deoxyribose-phosphate aldolase
MIKYEEIAKMIDHAVLQPFQTDEDVIEGCKLADRYKVASVCVRPSDVVLANRVLENSEVLVTTVIGFPHGTTTTKAKLEEIKDVIKEGVVEIDVVVNIGKVKSKEFDYVKNELILITEYAHKNKVIVKLIFENCYLYNSEKIKLCEICNEVNVDYAKTSTGFGSSGSKDEDLILMRKHCKDSIKIKAAGGIKTLDKALKVKELGCARFGASSTKEILEAVK